VTSNLSARGELGITAIDVAKFFTVILVAAIMANVAMALTGSSQASQYIQSQMYQGVTDPREHDVTSEGVKVDLVNGPPYTPWVSAQFINDGPCSVWVTIDCVDESFQLKVNENATINRIGALTRIPCFTLVCEAGGTAVVRIWGEY